MRRYSGSTRACNHRLTGSGLRYSTAVIEMIVVGCPLIRISRDQSFEEGRGGGPSRLSHQLHEGELAGAIDRHVEVELAFGGLELGDVDVEIADRISLELFLRGSAAFDLRQSADAVALQAAMQG